MLERGVKVDHTTIYRWVQPYSPERNKRCHPYLRPTNDSWRVDETYCKIKGTWEYLYGAVDSAGNTLDFLLTAKRDAKAAKRLLSRLLNAAHTIEPRVITVDKNTAYPPTIAGLKAEEALPERKETRQIKYLNNLVKQEHRFIKRRVNPGLRFGSFNMAKLTPKGYKAMNMIRKGQSQDVDQGGAWNRFSSSTKSSESLRNEQE